MKYILLIPVLGFVIACNNPGEKLTASESTNSADSAAQVSPLSVDTAVGGCYGYQSARDTVLMQLEVNGTNVSGPLSYMYSEKDRNDGTFQGSLSGDTLSGYYLFKSEGIMSVRQEIWKVSNGTLVPGTGEMMQRNDSMLFKSPQSVQFDNNRALKKRMCTT